MPKILNSENQEFNDGYGYKHSDWPDIPRKPNLPTTFQFSIAYKCASEGVNFNSCCQIWIPTLNLPDRLSGSIQFLCNICRIVNIDINNLINSATSLSTLPFKDGHFYGNPDIVLINLANGWNLLLRLRLMLDVALKIWTFSQIASSIPRSDKIDCVGRFISNTDALNALNIKQDAEYFLKFINNAANNIKHPHATNDFASPVFPPHLIIFNEETGRMIAQPILDMVMGSNHFMAILMGAMN